MIRKLKIAAILVTLTGGVAFCHAQQTHTVSFSYDLDGNRILRQIVIGGGSGDRSINQEQQYITDSFRSFSVTLYPNPTNGSFSVAVNGLEEITLFHAIITTVSGAIVYDRTFSDNQESFDLTRQPAGIYLLQLTDGKQSHEWKVIKK